MDDLRKFEIAALYFMQEAASQASSAPDESAEGMARRKANKESWAARVELAEAIRRRRGRDHGILAAPRPWAKPLFTLDKPRNAVGGKWVNPYPEEMLLLPTQLGNVLRAAESYGLARYQLNMLVLWNELVAEAPSALVDSARDAEMQADTMLSLYWASVALSLSAGGAIIYVASTQSGSLIGGPAVCFLTGITFAIVAYRGLMTAARDWGEVMRALVNQGRNGVRQRYGLNAPESIHDERAMWTALVRFILYGDPAMASDLDRWRAIDKQE